MIGKCFYRKHANIGNAGNDKMKGYPGISKVISATPGYAVSSYKDLGTFLALLPDALKIGTLDLYNATVIHNSTTMKATGISVYLTKYPSSAYTELRFAKDTGWYDFLKNIKEN